MFELRSVERMFCKRIVAWVMTHVFSFSLPCSCAAVDKPDRCFPMVSTWHAIHRRLGRATLSQLLSPTYLPSVPFPLGRIRILSFRSVFVCFYGLFIVCDSERLKPATLFLGFVGGPLKSLKSHRAFLLPCSNLFFIVDFFCKLMGGNVSWEIIYLLANLFHS